MSSNEEKPSVLSSRVFKVRDWNRLEAYRLDTKIQALETAKKWAETRISFEQREVKKDLLKLREATQNRRPSLAERRLGFALKRNSSDLALRIEKCQQAFTGPNSVAPPHRCRADSEPAPDVCSLPPVIGERRTGVSTPPSWTERRFNAAQRLASEEPKTRVILRKQCWSSSHTLAQSGHIERLAESTEESVDSPLSNESAQEGRDKTQANCPSISTMRPSIARPKPLLRRSYSTNSMMLTSSATGKEMKYRELASLTETHQLPCISAPASPRSSRGGQNSCKLKTVSSCARQRSYTMPGLSTDGPRVNEKLGPLGSDSGSQ